MEFLRYEIVRWRVDLLVLDDDVTGIAGNHNRQLAHTLPGSLLDFNCYRIAKVHMM